MNADVVKKILITGIGSILRGDDGIGVRVIDELEKEDLPREVLLHSGDVSGLDLLKVFPGHEKVIIIDAADMAEAPGTVKVFNAEDIKREGFKDVLSTHGMGLLETLTLAKNLDLGSEIVIIGVQPLDISYNLELSDLMKSKIPQVVEEIKKLIH